MTTMRRVLVLMMASVLILAAPARAADYPSKPIKIVVPFPAGSASDLRTRKLAEQLGPKLGQSVIVENRPGAAGTIGAGVVARSAPDGYTLLYGTNSILSVAPHVQPAARFDPLSAFAVVSHVANTPLVVVIPSTLPAQSLREFIALAKRQPGSIAYGTSGVGSIQHIGIEQLAEISGMRLLHVPYKGESEVLTGLLGGQVQMGYCTLMVCLPYMKNGKLRALGVTSPRRFPTLPDVPTVAEAGAPGYELQATGGLFAPAATPKPILDKLYRASESTIRSPEMMAWTVANGSEVGTATPQEFMTMIRQDHARYGVLVKKLGIRAGE
jgi:tripartite-type tricarboxylate transporter receptor subunit TctC